MIIKLTGPRLRQFLHPMNVEETFFPHAGLKVAIKPVGFESAQVQGHFFPSRGFAQPIFTNQNRHVQVFM
jgi:hypothetical protein